MNRSLCVDSIRWAISWTITYSIRSLGFFTSSVLSRMCPARWLQYAPTVVLGDLNANPTSPPACGGAHFRRVLNAEWRRAEPVGGASFFGHNGRRSEVDHILCNSGCVLAD